MKIGVLTLNLNYNYGGIMQAYALCYILKEMGHTPLLIQRKKKRTSIRTAILIISLLLNRKTLFFEGHLSHFTKQFINEHIKSRTKRLSEKDLYALCKKQNLDAIVVGSDQVWRKWGGRMVRTYFLDFCTDTNIRKIAYGASFGVDTWQYTPEETIFIRNSLLKFDAISVREMSSVLLCKKYLGLSVSLVIDPTMLLDVGNYYNLIQKENDDSSNMIIEYYLDKTKEKRIISQKVADKLSCSINAISVKKDARLLNLIFSSSDCIWPSVESWLKALSNAKFVVTDSFHGTVFSILFHRPFVVIGNDVRGMARIESLLKTFGLDERLISDPSMLNTNIYKVIDWNRIDKILMNMREKSMHFLLNALK